MDSYEAQSGSRIEGLALQPGADWKLLPQGATVTERYSYAGEEASVFVLEA
jgi:hypothetical protein